MPHIRNWKDLNFYRQDKETIYQHIDALFTEQIDWELIRTHWQDLINGEGFLVLTRLVGVNARGI